MKVVAAGIRSVLITACTSVSVVDTDSRTDQFVAPAGRMCCPTPSVTANRLATPVEDHGPPTAESPHPAWTVRVKSSWARTPAGGSLTVTCALVEADSPS